MCYTVRVIVFCIIASYYEFKRMCTAVASMDILLLNKLFESHSDILTLKLHCHSLQAVIVHMYNCRRDEHVCINSFMPCEFCANAIFRLPHNFTHTVKSRYLEVVGTIFLQVQNTRSANLFVLRVFWTCKSL